VNDEGVPNDDMPNFLRPAARDGLPFSDAALAALLAGTEPPEPMPGLQPVSDVLAALRSGPTREELAGEASVLAEFRRGAGVAARTPAPHRPRRVTSLVGARVAVAAAAVTLGGLATAAYAGMLPAPVQRLAHDTIGAPAAPSGSPAATHLARSQAPVRPGASGSTAHRLCTAYTAAKAHGTAAQRAAAFHNLVGAAGGAGKIAAFCGTAAHPGKSGAHSGNGSSNGNHGKGASNGNHGKGASNGNHGKGSSNGNQGNGSSNGNHAKGSSNGNQGTGASQGNHGKGASQGNQGQGGPPGHQNGHHVPKGKSSAHGGGYRGKQGAPYASGQGAHKPLHASERSPRAH
jgi:hypothetical protein